MRVVLLRHPRVAVAELLGDDGHRHTFHGQSDGIGVAQDVEGDGRRDLCRGAGVSEEARAEAIR